MRSTTVSWMPMTPTAPPESAEKADLTATDADGLPDAWETAHGFDPNDAADAAWTRIEMGSRRWMSYSPGLMKRKKTSAVSWSRRELRCSTDSPASPAAAPPHASKSAHAGSRWKSMLWQTASQIFPTYQIISFPFRYESPQTFSCQIRSSVDYRGASRFPLWAM